MTAMSTPSSRTMPEDGVAASTLYRHLPRARTAALEA